LDESRGAGVFLVSKRGDFSATSQRPISPNLASTRESMSPQNVVEEIFEYFSFKANLPPPKKKKLKIDGGETGTDSDQPIAQGTHCRET